MLRTRIIPVLLMRDRGLVKTERFRSPRYVGDPINIVRIFNEKEADELILLDIQATSSRARPQFELLEQVASEAFMPICYGGAVTSVADAKRLLRLGIEKVSVNTALFENPRLIEVLAGELGSQCVVASVDVKRTWTGKYEVFSHSGRPVREREVLRWIERLVKLGAGEVLVNAVDRDGTMKGYDLHLLRMIRGQFDVPIIACGGAESLDDMRGALHVGHLDALGVGARFVYEGPHRAVLISYLSSSEISSLAHSQ